MPKQFADSNNNTNTTMTKCSTKHDFPGEIMFEIFSRLSILDLSHCRFVCKDWFNLIKDPFFVNLYTNTLAAKDPSFLIFRDASVNKLSVIDYESNMLGSTLDLYPHPVRIVGSCNGLLCFRFLVEPKTFYICNPITRETLKLPKAPDMHLLHENYSSAPAGFAFDAITNQYKVIYVWSHIYTSDSTRIYSTRIGIYTLGSSHWRNVECFPNCGYNMQPDQVIVNGALHWNLCSIGNAIVALDIGTEKFKAFRAPPASGSQFLISLRESLCSAHSGDDGIALWIMNDYGVESSWTKTYVIRNERLGPLRKQPFSILSTSKAGSFLLLGIKHQGYYNMEKEEFERIAIDGIPQRSKELNAVVHRGSLISPKSLGNATL